MRRLTNVLCTTCQQTWPHTASFGSVLRDTTFYQQQSAQQSALSADWRLLAMQLLLSGTYVAVLDKRL
jgi:hypothetical protein